MGKEGEKAVVSAASERGGEFFIKEAGGVDTAWVKSDYCKCCPLVPMGLPSYLEPVTRWVFTGRASTCEGTCLCQDGGIREPNNVEMKKLNAM